ncbi:MAG: Holliday junction resolvase RuvX [Candidatus Moraniibacteriota bacterium]|nr:MAG: Holliday junction resolvase RuvX [Candidatus Moranbacteria bacterium]
MQKKENHQFFKKQKKRARVVRKNFEKADFMGIDWGKSDIGIALADESTRISFAYTTLDNSLEIIKKIGEIIQEKEVKTVIIGIPSPINREEVFYDAEKLGELLENNYGVVVHYQNEMFSTKIAQMQLIEKGVHQIQRYDDEEAARIILQDWLERKILL